MASGNKLGSSWETTSHSSDPLRKGLVERAKKRTVRAKRDRNWWAVSGSSTLGDAYDFYDVHLRADGSYGCSCTNNQGGEYRRNACSHRTAVILYRQEHEDPWDETDGGSELEGDNLDSDHESRSSGVAEGGGESSVRGSAGEASPPEAIELPDGWTIETIEPVSKSSEGGVTHVGLPTRPVSDSRKAPPSDALDSPFDPYDLDEDDAPTPQDIAAYWKGSDYTIPPLPEKFKGFRESQWLGILDVVEALDAGKKVVFLSAPTGSGKSLVAAAVPQILGKSFVYTATTHTLQDQVEREFNYAKVLKGRRNYPTHDDPTNPDLTADDCTKELVELPACPSCPGYNQGSSWGAYDDERGSNQGMHCHNCHPVSQCPYEVAKQEAHRAHMAVLNTTYYLSETNFVFNSLFRGKELVFIDEADMLEEELMGFITVEISARTRKELGIGLPKKTVEEDWVTWIEDEVIPAIKAKLSSIPKARIDLFGRPDKKVNREKKRLKRLLDEVASLLKPAPVRTNEELKDLDPDEERPPAILSGWVMTGYEGEDESKASVIFKPIMVRDYARKVLWNQGGQFVLMSATIISPEQMAYDLGLDDDEWAVVEIPSSFPKERRPVVIRPKIDVIKTTMDSGEAYPILVEQLLEIEAEHPDERILVHSNSYKLTRELFFESRKRSNAARSRSYAYFYTHERAKALADYLADPRGVLIAPSFERGVDLHGDDCRVVVIAKVPFPYLGDKQVKARLYSTGRSGKVWYTVQTIRTICQMTGRGMRSADDWAINYILDKSFLRVYWDNQHLFPSWWREALVLDETDPKWREPLRILRAGEL